MVNIWLIGVVLVDRIDVCDDSIDVVLASSEASEIVSLILK